MKRLVPYITMFMLIHLGFSGNSQMKLSTLTINSTGHSSTNGSMKLSWSVAEMSLVHTITTPSMMVSLGILQPEKHNNNTATEFPKGYIKVYPTLPVNFISVAANIPNEGKLSITVLDAQVKIYHAVEYQINEGQVTYQIPVQNLKRGLYFLKLAFMSSSGQNNYTTISKFIKL